MLFYGNCYIQILILYRFAIVSHHSQTHFVIIECEGLLHAIEVLLQNVYKESFTIVHFGIKYFTTNDSKLRLCMIMDLFYLHQYCIFGAIAAQLYTKLYCLLKLRPLLAPYFPHLRQWRYKSMFFPIATLRELRTQYEDGHCVPHQHLVL